MKILILLIACLFVLTVSQYKLKQLDQKCICDTISNQCDSQCCCDNSCNTNLIKKWKQYNLCLDDSLGIPFCSTLAQNDINVLDLHSGLRTIYSVIKRLFCINSVNFIQPTDWYKKTATSTDLQTQLSEISISQSQSILNSNIQSLPKITIQNLPLKGSNGLCYSSKKLTSNNDISSSCRVYIDSFSNINTTLLSIQNIQSKIGIIKKYSSKIVSSSTSTNQTLQTSCNNIGNCTNVVKELRIFINTQNGTINSNSYAVLGPVNIPNIGYIKVNYQYTFVKTINKVTQFPLSSYQGYQFGSKLNLLYQQSTSTTVKYHKIFNPINLAYKKLDGTCRRLSTEQSANSVIQLKFGQNQIYSCVGSSNLISQNLLSSFNMIGKYGMSSNILADYLSISSQTLSNTQSVQLLIYYINLGIPEKTQYKIQKVQTKFVTSKDGLSTLYIEYINVQNKYSLYVPPAPKVDAYLPNDFLYPFYVA